VNIISNKLAGVVLAATLAVSAWTGPASAQVEGLEFTAVSGVGSGLDQTSRALQAALEKEGLASRVQVETKPGGSGTVGLAYFITTKGGRGNSIMVASTAQMMAVDINKSPVTFDQVRPLARIVGEYVVIVVAAQSEIKTLADLTAKLKSNPTSVSWAGGSPGSADHLLVGLVAQKSGVDISKVNYVAHAGGGEANAAILGGHVTAGAGTYGELSAQIKSGGMRILGVASPEPVPGIDAPTLKAQGLDVVVLNWRGLFVPADIKDADYAKLNDMVTKLQASASWKETVKERSWFNIYQPGPEFAAFFKEDQAQAREVLKSIGLLK
jgi:putative tricarboxylic transport membrane protein